MSGKVKNVGPISPLVLTFDNGYSLSVAPREISRVLTDAEMSSVSVQRHLTKTNYLRLIP